VSMETLDLLRSGQLAGAKRLALNCGLTQFPTEIFELAESLEVLDLSNNHLKFLPSDFAKLSKLKAAFFINNEFEEIPEIVAQCPHLDILGFKSNRIQSIRDQALSPSLRWLILTDNQLDQLPAMIGNLKNLQKLMLAGNNLRSLPDEMAACQNLELIRLSANQLKALPPWLLTLPRLSWLAYAGNPFCSETLKVERPLTSIDWNHLSLENNLGEGASGIIYKGIWHTSSTQTRAVAVKVFKGEITSDGLPADEMQACIAAGSHANLVNVLGQVINHPEAKTGLVLSLIPPDYKNLGQPPSLETCTRDIYPPNTTFSFTSIHRIIQGIATAAAQLHRRGILHGDLYAHNILTNNAGESLFGDFGAASFYDPINTAAGQTLERLEVRAFGCLLDDLLTHCDRKQALSQPEAMTKLLDIQQDCMHPNPSLRPLFTTVCERLASIKSIM
jgi:Protein tyrosine and serine/threonine kinase/Leucine rich repeat